MFHQHGDLRHRTREFARRVARACGTLSARNRVARIWGGQLLRAGGSVGANYWEAQRGRSRAEYRSKLGDCLREADASLYWMELLELEGCFSAHRIQPLKQAADELISFFVTLLK